MPAGEYYDKKTILSLVTFGLVGAGSLYYYRILRQKIEDLEENIGIYSSQVFDLKKQVAKIQESTTKLEVDKVAKRVRIKENRQEIEAMREKMFNNFTDEEYVTASSDDEREREELRKNKELQYEDQILMSNENVSKGVDLARGEISQNLIDHSTFFGEIDILLEGTVENQNKAYLKLKEFSEKMGNSCDFWCRFARAAHYKGNVAQQNEDIELRKKFIEEANSYAKRALELDEEAADAHKWFAITIGTKGDFVGINEKIQNGYLFKSHVDKAILLKPADGVLYHLLGRFCFEVSQLGWMERKVASTLFSAPPSSTTEEALGHFKNYEKYGKPFKENKMFIAKCYIAQKDYKTAGEWLEKAMNLPVKSASDENAQNLILQLISKYKNYF